jgi:hypothetical protein
MSKDYKLLAEPYSLTAYFRSILNISNSFEIINFLIKTSNLSLDELSGRWDNFDKIFWQDYWNKISALSFATIIEARWILLNSILETKNNSNNLIIELASGFTPRGLSFVNKSDINYIETDRESVVELKTEFYNYLNSTGKNTPELKILDVLNKDDFKNLYDYISIKKLENKNLDKITLLSEWLVIYLDKNEQKVFFDNIRYLAKLLKSLDIELSYLTIDMPSHENFTNWLVHENFTLKDHLDVMSKVEPKIIESLHNTQNDFISENSLWEIKKYFYTNEIITSLKTPKLPKYKKIDALSDKIHDFLSQDILFAWEKEF